MAGSVDLTPFGFTPTESQVYGALLRLGPSTGYAVAHGIKISAGVVTAAAVIMVFVFLTFATMSMVQLKEMGVGLAVAVLLDATIVRACLLPAATKRAIKSSPLGLVRKHESGPCPLSGGRQHAGKRATSLRPRRFRGRTVGTCRFDFNSES